MRTLWLAILMVAAEPSRGNLLPNGDFEKGANTPAGWQTVDGLTSFWVKEGDDAHGMVLKFDTSLVQSQAYEWWEKILHGASPKDAPAKKPFVGPGYDTLAGLDGVWFYSDAVEIQPAKAYWLTLDVKGPGEMMVWLLGYTKKPDLTFGGEALAFRGWLGDKNGTRDPQRNHRRLFNEYDWKGQLKAGPADVWKTFSRREKPFRPTQQTPQVRYVRVLLLPLWPPGIYYVDNVRLTEVSDPAATKRLSGSDER